MAKLLSGTRIYGTATVDTQIFVSGSNAASSTITGALQVIGGAGIGGNLYVGGTIYGTVTTATNIAAGTAGQLVYQTGPGATSFAGPGIAGQILLSSGTSAPVYTNTSSIYVGRAALADSATTSTTANTSNNLSGGSAGSIPYQTGAGATTMLAIGTSGYVLTAGASAPQWSSFSGLSVGTATTATNVTIANETTSSTVQYITFTSISAGSSVLKVAATTGLTYLPNSGYVGMGIATPTSPLHIVSSGNSIIKFRGATTGSIGVLYSDGTQLAFLDSTSANGFTILPNSSNVSITTNATEAIRVDSVQQVGINTNRPNYRLDVRGQTYIGAASTLAQLILGDTTNSTTATISTVNSDLIFSANGTAEALRITSSKGIAFGGSTNYGTSGQLLKSAGNASPTWVDQSTITAGSVVYPHSTGTGLIGSAYNGSAAVTWSLNTATLMTTAVTANNLAASATLGGSGYLYIGGYNTNPSSVIYPTPFTVNSTGPIAIADNFSGGNVEANIWNTVYPSSYANTGFRFQQLLTASTYRDLVFFKNTGAVAFGGTSNFGSSGQLLQSNGDAAPTWVNASGITSGATSLTNTYVGFGSGSNLLTGSSNLTWNGTTLYVNGRLQNAGGLKTYSVQTTGQGNVNAVYEIMKVSRDAVNWSTNTSYEITVYSSYYTSGGYTKWLLSYGYGDTGTLVCTYAGGGSGMLRVYLGSEVSVNANCQYKPVFVDLPPYMMCTVEVRYNTSEVGTIASSGQVLFSNIMTASGGTGAYHTGATNLVPNGGTVAIGNGATPGSARLHVVATAATGIGSVPAGTTAIMDSNTNNYLLFRNTIDNGTYSGIAFQDNNIGGYVLFGNAGGGGDQLWIGGYSGGNLQAGTSDTIDRTARTTMLSWNSSGVNLNGAISFNGTSNYGSSGQILQSNGNAAPTWVGLNAATVGNATTATNLAGGTAGQIPYQTGPGTTGFMTNANWSSSNSILSVTGTVQATVFSRTGAVNASSWTTTSPTFSSGANAFNDTSSAASATVSARVAISFLDPSFTANNAGVVITDAVNLYVKAPVAGTNVSFTNNWGIYNQGNSFVGGSEKVTTSLAVGSYAVTANAGDILASGNGMFGYSTAQSSARLSVNGAGYFNGTVTATTFSGPLANTLTISSPLSGTSFNNSSNTTIALASGYGDTQNPYASKTANYFLAAPNGSAGAPTFRAIVAADIPTLNQNTTGQAGSVVNSLTINNGGSGSASGVTFNGSSAITISYNTVGAPSTSGANASGTWSINISGNLTASAPQLAAATESNSIYITAPGYNTDKPVKLLNFDWYGNLFSIGNIRSGATPSNGFGFYYTASGGSITELARFTTAGALSFGSSGSAYGSSGQLLQSNGNASPTWVNTSGITAGNSINAINIYQSTDPSAGTYRLLLGNGTNAYATVYNKSALYWNDTGSIIQGANISGNSATVGGFTPSQTGGTANRVVVADANGYIANNYFYTSGGGSERNASGIGYFAGFNSSDYYIRSYTAAAVLSAISALPLAGGTMTGLIVGKTNTGGSYVGSNDSGSMSVRGDGSNGAIMSFHRPGIYAINMGLDTDNIFKIGGWSAGSTYVGVSGGQLFATSEIIAYYSDGRLKTNLGNITGALDAVTKLNGFRYTNNELAKTFGYTDEKVQLGVDAQEIEALFPEIVTIAPFDITTDPETGKTISKSGENYKTVRYEKLVPVLIEAIKEQQQQIAQLTEMVNKLINK